MPRNPNPPMSPRDREKYEMPKKVVKPKPKATSPAIKGSPRVMPKPSGQPQRKLSGAVVQKPAKKRKSPFMTYEKPVKIRKTK